MIYIETNRLILRDWIHTDLELFIKLNKDKDVRRFFPDVLSKEQSISSYNNITKDIKENNFGLFACELKDNKQFIGFIGLHETNLPGVIDNNFIEIGWRLDKAYWNKGLATEGALACIEYGFSKLNLSEIYSFTSKLNLPSQRVMEKINMTFVKDFNHPRVSHESPLYPHVLYCIKNKGA